MKTCPRCHSSFTGKTVCPHCGVPLESPQRNYCPKHGYYTGNACPKCIRELMDNQKGGI